MCGSLVNFLTIALVHPLLTQKETWTLQAQAGKAGYVPGPMTTSYRCEHILYRDLPGICPGTILSTASDPALVDVARGMRDMVAKARDERHDRLDHREEARCSRTVHEKLSNTITDWILLLCQASDDDNLPCLYPEWVACTREVSERYVIQQAVGASCAVHNIPVFEVTPTQVMTFNKFRLAGSSYFNIGSSLLPF
jgi:hypothetical protein